MNQDDMANLHLDILRGEKRIEETKEEIEARKKKARNWYKGKKVFETTFLDLVCKTCGANVDRSAQSLHNLWHREQQTNLIDVMDRIDSMAGMVYGGGR